MSPATLTRTSERPADASVVVRALDIPGARHEVLPPRKTAAGAVALFRSSHRAPPP